MNEIYLDNAATTKPSLVSVNAMKNAAETLWGNPSSFHRKGDEASAALNFARNEILLALHGEKILSLLPQKQGMTYGGGVGRLVFTSSGTEANNLAIFGTLSNTKITAPRIITTDSEHPSVLECFKKMESLGFDVVYLKTLTGVVDEEQLKNSLNSNTVLVSIMLANNETGAVYNTAEIFKTVKRYSKTIVCHSDCIQAFQKTPFSPDFLNADLITLSAHKLHAPKGAGALWLSDEIFKKNRLSTQVLGGGQEFTLRSGTENIPSIAAFAAAVKDNGSFDASSLSLEKISALRDLLIKNLPQNVLINQPAQKFLPHIISLTLPVPKSQPVLNYLSSKGIFISSGSACSSHKNTVSPVLLAFGLSRKHADSTVRVSLSKYNTTEDVKRFCSILKEIIPNLSGEKFRF